MTIRPRVFRRGPAPRARDRRGFTLVELIVAIMILVVGLLALAGTSALITRQMGTGARTTVAATVAQARLDFFASMDCTQLAIGGATTTGTSSGRGVTERWVVTDGNDVKYVTDTVRIAGQTRPLVYHSVIPCRD